MAGLLECFQGLKEAHGEGGFKAVLATTPMRILGSVLGIVGSLIVYGILQERVMTQPYGDEDELFTQTIFLVLNNRAVSAIVAVIIIYAKELPARPVAKWWEYCAVSLSNVASTTCQYEALKYISFPVQTLGKCAKMIPVMIWGTIMMKKTYTPTKYLIALAITGGCTAFALGGSISSKHSKPSSDTSIYGVGLMLGYLGFDGFTSTFQDKLFKGYMMETYNQMLWVNTFSGIISFFISWFSGELLDAVEFVTRHPSVMRDISILSVCATVAQLFILYTIKNFGALVFATIMTTRQFMSILLSCLIFVHPLGLQQWLATGVIFAALYTEAFGKGSSESTPKEGGKDAAGEGEALLGKQASNAEEGIPKNIEEEGQIPLQELRSKEDREVVNYGATAETVKQA